MKRFLQPVEFFPKECSVVLQMVSAPLTRLETRRVLDAEIRWHYSTHYLAEDIGEEMLTDILSYSHGDSAKAMLHTQLKDELQHARLFKKIIERIGLDERAANFSLAYSQLMRRQKTLTEKIFIFQILTEAVSQGYCAWRLGVISDPDLNQVDAQVFADERRHLKMGHSLLRGCDTEELANTLTPLRMRELLREMNEICKNGIQQAMRDAVLPPGIECKRGPVVSVLDRTITRSVFKEVHSITKEAESAGQLLQ